MTAVMLEYIEFPLMDVARMCMSDCRDDIWFHESMWDIARGIKLIIPSLEEQ